MPQIVEIEDGKQLGNGEAVPACPCGNQSIDDRSALTSGGTPAGASGGSRASKSTSGGRSHVGSSGGKSQRVLSTSTAGSSSSHNSGQHCATAGSTASSNSGSSTSSSKRGAANSSTSSSSSGSGSGGGNSSSTGAKGEGRIGPHPLLWVPCIGGNPAVSTMSYGMAGAKDPIGFAAMLRSRGKVVEALQMYDAVLAERPGCVEALVGKGMCLQVGYCTFKAPEKIGSGDIRCSTGGEAWVCGSAGGQRHVLEGVALRLQVD